jgi:hypothetical protein
VCRFQHLYFVHVRSPPNLSLCFLPSSLSYLVSHSFLCQGKTIDGGHNYPVYTQRRYQQQWTIWYLHVCVPARVCVLTSAQRAYRWRWRCKCATYHIVSTQNRSDYTCAFFAHTHAGGSLCMSLMVFMSSLGCCVVEILKVGEEVHTHTHTHTHLCITKTP